MSAEETEAGILAFDVREPETDGKPGPGKPPATPRRGWSMSVINFWLDVALLVVLMVLGWVVAMLKIVFPAPTMAAGWTLWGWDYNQWNDFQFGVLCAFGLVVAVHVMLHWNWVCSVIANQILHVKRPDEGMQTIYGVGLLIVVLHVIGFGVLLALFMAKHPVG